MVSVTVIANASVIVIANVTVIVIVKMSVDAIGFLKIFIMIFYKIVQDKEIGELAISLFVIIRCFFTCVANISVLLVKGFL